MRKFLASLVLLLGLVISAAAQTPQTVTGAIASGSGSPCNGGTGGTSCFVRITLRNYKGFVPRVLNVAVIAPTQLIDVIPNSSGVFSTTLYTNDVIQPLNCGLAGNTPCTYYTVEYWYGGRELSAANYQFLGAGPFNLLTQAPVSPTPPPPPPFPFSTGSVVSVGTDFPLTGGPITVSGNIGCLECIFSTSGVQPNQIITGVTGQQVTQAGNPYLANASSPGAILQGYLSSGTTTAGLVVKLNGTNNTVVTVGTSDTEALGICTAQCGTGGSTAEIALLGSVLCTFDNTTVAGHYVQISSTSAGQCHDAGASIPTSGSVILGRVINNGAAGPHIVSVNLIPVVSGSIVITGQQIGDILRYNVNGSGSWNPVNYAQSFVALYAVNQTGTLNSTGALGAGGAALTGSSSDAVPTATSQAGKIVSAAATASLNTVIGFHFGENGTTSLLGMLSFYRWSTKFAAGGTTNVRYWIGLGCVTTGGALGNNNLGINGTTAYAADAPNKTTLGFRYSAGTDTNWQAVAVLASGGGGSQTVVDTGVAVDTNPHVFEMTTNATGTSVFFFIDGNLVATISTNLPVPAQNGNSWGDLFFTGDNKNTNNAISATIYWTQMSLK